MNLAQFSKNVIHSMPYISVNHDPESSTVTITDVCGEMDYRTVISDDATTKLTIAKTGETDGVTHSLSHYGDAKDIAGLPHYINKMFIRLSQIDDKLFIATPEPDCDDGIPF